MSSSRAFALFVLVAACSSAKPAARGPDPGATSASVPFAAPEGPPPSAPPRADAKVDSKKKKLTIDEARRYMLDLVNADRKSEGLAPVELDVGAATAAGQAHAEDMAAKGYLGHWGSDGSVPEQRTTEAGGADMVLENALCFVDEKPRALDPRPFIDVAEIERAESMFFHETPPNDGHRKNILKPGHRKVGIGVAQPAATATEIPVPCFSQEFTDPYGAYAPLPKTAKVGQIVRVEGSVHGPAKVAGVGVARAETPKPLPVAELNKRRSYPVPQPYQMYWPTGFKTPIPVMIDGERFSVDVPLSDRGQPGLYEVSVWGKLPASNDYVMLGLRTILVER
jgi:uncharacterized protein YkwD